MVGIQTQDFDIVVKVEKNALGQIEQGMVIGDILRQNQALILKMHKGELKERPDLGVGIDNMLLDHDPLYWRTIIREQLELDNQTVDSVSVSLDDITINSHY